LGHPVSIGLRYIDNLNYRRHEQTETSNSVQHNMSRKWCLLVSTHTGCFSVILFHPLLLGDVQDSQGVSASEMTYTVSDGALNSTHSLL